MIRVGSFRKLALAVATTVLLAAAFSVGLAFAQGDAEPEMPSPADCSSSVAVLDPANNPGLVSDCETLLSVRDTLAGSVNSELVDGHLDCRLGWCHRRWPATACIRD